MFFKILKKDLKRSKTMNIILFLFIVLATIFVSSGMSNLVSVMNGIDYFVEQSVGDKGEYILLVTNLEDSGAVKEFDEADSVKSYGYDKALMLSITDVDDKDGDDVVDSGVWMVQSPENTFAKFFDSENNVVTEVKAGHAYVSSKLIDTELEAGDRITVKYGDIEKEFIIDGGIKDAVLGSSLASIDRLFINDSDLREFYDEDERLTSSGIPSLKGGVFYIATDDIKGVKAVTTNIKYIAIEAPKSTLKMTYVMEMLIAFIIMILSICLIIVSFVILRFSIGFTIQDDFREIGVMKAIGIRNFKIRSLYLVKYMALSICGAFVGCIISIPFGKMLLASASKNMILGNDIGDIINAIGAVIVAVLIIWLAYLVTGRVKKMTPVDAIRSGETGERFNKKRGYRISRSHAKNYIYLAWNDFLSTPKRYLNVIVSFTVCMLLLLIISNTTATADSAAFIDTFGAKGDLYINGGLDRDVIDASDLTESDSDSAMDILMMTDGKEKYKEYLDRIEDKLNEEGMNVKVHDDVSYALSMNFNGTEYNYRFNQVIGNKVYDLQILEGSAPENKNEVAITDTVAREIGLKIGDTIEVDYGDVKEKCTVTGKFQSMINFGSVIRLHEDAPTDGSSYTGNLGKVISFTDNPSQEEIEARKEKIKDILKTEDILDQKETCVKNMGVVDSFKSVESLLTIVTVLVIFLVTVMMERSFIAKENKQIAILKAVGFRDNDVVRWQVMRFFFIALISVGLATVISIPITRYGMGSIFSAMGATSIKFVIDAKSLLKYPIILVTSTVVISWITGLYTGTIKARDTASIE